MAISTVWNGGIPAGGGTPTSTATGNRNDSLVFTVTTPCALTAIGYYVPAGETTLTGSSYTAALYTTVTGTSGTLVTSQAGSGTFTAGGWNWIPINASLSPGTNYSAVVNFPNTLEFISSFWGQAVAASGFTSGPINVPSQASAPGTVVQGFLSGALAFPGSTNSPGTWYGIDVQVSYGPLPMPPEQAWPFYQQRIR